MEFESTERKDRVTPEDILAVAGEVASPAVSARVWQQAVSGPRLRDRFAQSLPPDPDDEDAEIAAALSTVQQVPSSRLQRRLDTLTQKFVVHEENPDAKVNPVNRTVERVLGMLDTLLTLPCLAPAIAAPDPQGAVRIQTQTVITPENVRIEFQQLPSRELGATATETLRIIVDASGLGDETDYEKAVVTVAEGVDTKFSITVSLNPQGVGYTDTSDLPLAHSARRLNRVTLLEG